MQERILVLHGLFLIQPGKLIKFPGGNLLGKLFDHQHLFFKAVEHLLGHAAVSLGNKIDLTLPHIRKNQKNHNGKNHHQKQVAFHKEQHQLEIDLFIGICMIVMFSHFFPRKFWNAECSHSRALSPASFKKNKKLREKNII